MGERIGQLLLSAGRITQEQLESAQEYLGSVGGAGKLGRILVKLGYVKENELADFLAQEQGLARVREAEVSLTDELMRLIPRGIVEKHEVLPVRRKGKGLVIAVPDPTDYEAIEEVRFCTGLDVQIAVISHGEAQNLISRYYGGEETEPRPTIKEPIAKVKAEAMVSSIDGLKASPAALTKALAVALVEKGVLSLDDIRTWLTR